MDWTEKLENGLSRRKVEPPAGQAEIAKGLVEIGLNLLARFTLNTNAELRMLPNQWDVARYHGDRRWELLPRFDFLGLGEMLLLDSNPKGAGILACFQLSKGEKLLRAGFLLPQRIGEGGERAFFMTYEERVTRADIGRLWELMKPGVERWFESLLRDDLAPLLTFCESAYSRSTCPRLPETI